MALHDPLRVGSRVSLRPSLADRGKDGDGRRRHDGDGERRHKGSVRLCAIADLTVTCVLRGVRDSLRVATRHVGLLTVRSVARGQAGTARPLPPVPARPVGQRNPLPVPPRGPFRAPRSCARSSCGSESWPPLCTTAEALRTGGERDGSPVRGKGRVLSSPEYETTRLARWGPPRGRDVPARSGRRVRHKTMCLRMPPCSLVVERAMCPWGCHLLVGANYNPRRVIHRTCRLVPPLLLSFQIWR